MFCAVHIRLVHCCELNALCLWLCTALLLPSTARFVQSAASFACGVACCWFCALCYVSCCVSRVVYAPYRAQGWPHTLRLYPDHSLPEDTRRQRLKDLRVQVWYHSLLASKNHRIGHLSLLRGSSKDSGTSTKGASAVRPNDEVLLVVLTTSCPFHL